MSFPLTHRSFKREFGKDVIIGTNGISAGIEHGSHDEGTSMNLYVLEGATQDDCNIFIRM